MVQIINSEFFKLFTKVYYKTLILNIRIASMLTTKINLSSKNGFIKMLYFQYTFNENDNLIRIWR